MATRQDGELNHEYEDELLAELQAETGAHEGLPEQHYQQEQELGQFEDELAAHESALHEFNEFGGSHEFLGEHPEGQAFFGKFRKLARGIGKFVSRAAPVFRAVAGKLVPMVAGAVGGPLGGIIGKVAAQALGEDELSLEDEFGAHELLGEDELSHEFGAHEALPEYGFSAHEALPELGAHELLGEFGSHEAQPEAQHEVMAEVMAEVAAMAQYESEAEAMAGAAAVAVLTARDRAALRRLLPHLVRGVAVLTRVLRQQRLTRPAVRTVPAIVRQTVRTLRARAASGAPLTRREAGRVMAAVTRRVLTSPRACGAAIVRNLRATGGTARPVAG